MTGVRFGVVADDLTGACDVAGRVAETGLGVVIAVGVPQGPPDEHPDVTIIALKNRTAESSVAASESAAAGRWLLDHGADLLYQKYCSTFDSTEHGNIGPISDALARVVGAEGHPAMSVGTPATPQAGRTQYQGHLFVGDRLLSQSSMRDHPLTPMRDPDLVRVLGTQTPFPIELVSHSVVRRGQAAVEEELRHQSSEGVAHLMADAIDESDLDTVAAAVMAAHALAPRSVFAAGAAGLATALARWAYAHAGSRRKAQAEPSVTQGRRLILSGSASAATRMQVDDFRGTRIDIDPLLVAADETAAAAVLAARLAEAFASAPDSPVLVSATADPARVQRVHDALGVERSAALVEDALAGAARFAVDELMASHIVVAGGETSGAVVAALDVTRLHLGRQAAPGVPWSIGVGSRMPVALLLKSGNFGSADLFTTAWNSAP
jgi:3-dehydrotetronate 4-kinase